MTRGVGSMGYEIPISLDYYNITTAEYEESPWGYEELLIKDEINVHEEEILNMETSLEIITAVGLNDKSDDYVYIRFMTEIGVY